MAVLEKMLAVPLSKRADGTIHLTGSRVTLDTLVHCYEQGDSAEEIAEAFPTLTLGQIYGVIAYYLDQQAEIQAYLRQREIEAGKVRADIEAKLPSGNLRAKLLARRNVAD